jgi:predicted metal-dependent peptidase
MEINLNEEQSKKLLALMKKQATPDPEVLSQAHKRFEWLVGFMICRFKFVHHMLGMMTKNPNMHVPTMGVCVTTDGKFRLEYNPVWTMELDDDELTYVFYHEVNHIALHHCTRRPLTTDPKEKEMANVAHDLAVNELIPENESCKRPRYKKEDEQAKAMGIPPRYKKGDLCGTFVSEYKKEKKYADIEERQSAEWYFDYLKQKGWDKDNPSGGGGVVIQGAGSGNGFDDHGGWSEHELADEKVTIKIKDIDQGNLWGDMSATQKELILAAQVKKINWRGFIRNWAGNILWRDRITTRKKPNRRTGMVHPGYKRSYMDRGLVVGDTSGSVGTDLASMFLGVVNQLVEVVPIDFAQCDAGITEKPHPFDRRRDKIDFKGRGGTNFQPIIDLVDEMGYKWVMILTDGEAAAPTRPKRARVLWVLPPGHNPPVDWGERVHLQRHV